MKGLASEKRCIVEFEEIEKQPKLIMGGQMKDYQVRGSRPVLYVVVLADRYYSSMDCPFSLGCIIMVC